MPSEKDVRKLEQEYLAYCKRKQFEPFVNIVFYLANDGNRMRELFNSKGDFFQKANVMADTAFSVDTILNNAQKNSRQPQEIN